MPLSYQGKLYDDVGPLRPIDFIVKDIEVTDAFDNAQEGTSDPLYLPAAELVALHTRQQAQNALSLSHKLTENF